MCRAKSGVSVEEVGLIARGKSMLELRGLRGLRTTDRRFVSRAPGSLAAMVLESCSGPTTGDEQGIAVETDLKVSQSTFHILLLLVAAKDGACRVHLDFGHMGHCDQGSRWTVALASPAQVAHSREIEVAKCTLGRGGP